MTEEEIGTLLVKWTQKRGGIITEQDMRRIAAILGEHFLSLEETHLEDAMQVLGLVE